MDGREPEHWLKRRPSRRAERGRVAKLAEWVLRIVRYAQRHRLTESQKEALSSAVDEETEGACWWVKGDVLWLAASGVNPHRVWGWFDKYRAFCSRLKDAVADCFWALPCDRSPVDPAPVQRLCDEYRDLLEEYRLLQDVWSETEFESIHTELTEAVERYEDTGENLWRLRREIRLSARRVEQLFGDRAPATVVELKKELAGMARQCRRLLQQYRELKPFGEILHNGPDLTARAEQWWKYFVKVTETDWWQRAEEDFTGLTNRMAHLRGEVDRFGMRLPAAPLPETERPAQQALVVREPDDAAGHRPAPPAGDADEGRQPLAEPAGEDEAGGKDDKRCTHSPDFRSVSWFGAEYSFTGYQAACVKVWWECWERGTPEIGDITVLETAECQTKRISDLFKGHPAWGTMIVEGRTRGTHRLQEPQREKPERPAKRKRRERRTSR